VDQATTFKVPAYPLQEVFDPTGAGDAFAGGFMAHLARNGDLSAPNLRRAMVYGAAMGSFAVEAFGIQGFDKVTPADVRARVHGCRAHDMTLAGGETAELPDLYQPGQYDLAGTIVAVVEEGAALHGDRVRPGDVLIGYASNGLHTNGYALARRIVFDTLGLDV